VLMYMAGEGRQGWLAEGICRITRAFNCNEPTWVSEGAAMSGMRDMGAIMAELTAIRWSGVQMSWETTTDEGLKWRCSRRSTVIG
jgi:hypothetical protein